MDKLPPEKAAPGTPKAGHPFFPDHFLKEVLVMVIVAAVLIAIAAIRPASGFIGHPDPNAGPQLNFQPQWYLYYLYLVARRLSPTVATTLTVVLFVLVILVPFLDRNPQRKPVKRPVALGVSIVAIAAAIYMAGAGVETTLAAGSVNIEGMKGIHCSSCHSYLKGIETFEPTRETCLKCHADQGPAQGTFSANAPMNYTCQTCHKPHVGKNPVSCLTCHADQSKQGLHAKPAHQTCQACHKPHTWTVPADAAVRNICLTCHTDKQDHMSGIPCTACHKFSAQ